MAMLFALAMIFSYVESLIPINFGVPGMKLGVANLVTVTGLYFLEIPEVLAVSVLRVLLTGFLFGNGMSIIYSLAGAVVSLLAMVLVKKMDGISIVGVSITAVSYTHLDVYKRQVFIRGTEQVMQERSRLRFRLKTNRSLQSILSVQVSGHMCWWHKEAQQELAAAKKQHRSMRQ